MNYMKGTSWEQKENTAVTIGNFDGFHQGHRSLIQLMKEQAEENGLQSVIFTFLPHPMFVLKNRTDTALILSPDEKRYLAGQFQVDAYIEYPFTTEIASMPPERFARDVLFQQLKCKVLVVGEDYHFGKGHIGDSTVLKKIGQRFGVTVHTLAPVQKAKERISSSKIRTLLQNKDLKQANELLVQPYFILGRITEGKKLGRTIGFPTVNIVANPVKLFPPNGVYATITIYQNQKYAGVTNIGMNPTVNGNKKMIETYLFDFHKMVYGEEIRTYFYQFIRPEQKFADVEALKTQMLQDAEQSKQYFIKYSHLFLELDDGK